MSRTRVAIALSVVAGLSIAGCGSSDAPTSQDTAAATEPSAVVTALGVASRTGDGEKICNELFTSNLRISVQKASGRACAVEVEANVASATTKYTLTSLTVKDAVATAAVVDQQKRSSSLVLQKVGTTWRIARIGTATTTEASTTATTTTRKAS